MRRPCRCILNSHYILLKKDMLYYYEINKKNRQFPYDIFITKLDNIRTVSFSEDYFNLLFIDIKLERKNKLKKICSK